MAKVEDCPGFETFGADVKAASKAQRLARKALAEMVSISDLQNRAADGFIHRFRTQVLCSAGIGAAPQQA